MRARIALASLIFAACASSEEGSPSTMPILRKAGETKYTCAAEAPVANLAPPVWIGAHALVAQGSRFLLARVEGSDDPYARKGTLVVSAWTSSGETDRRIVQTSSTAGFTALSAFAATDDRWAAVFLEDRRVTLALFDGNEITYHALDSVAALPPRSFLFAREGGGWTFVWPNGDPLRPTGEILLAQIDASGAIEGDIRTLYTQPEGGWGIALTATSGALAWAEGGPNGTKIMFATLDATGELGTPQTIRETALLRGTFWTTRPGLVRSGDGFVVAWPEVSTRLGSRPDSAGQTEVSRYVLHLARVDANGALVGAPQPLSDAEDSIEHVEPELVDFHGDVAVVWSRGDVIYECAGCVPDHDLRMVILSPDLVPNSAVLELPYAMRGGLLGHETGVSGMELAIANRIQYHTSQDPALAFVRCQ